MMALITSGWMWCDVNRAWLNKFFSSYIATVVSMVNECVLGIDMQCGN